MTRKGGFSFRNQRNGDNVHAVILVDGLCGNEGELSSRNASLFAGNSRKGKVEQNWVS
jgi:hypothetical protein